MKITKIKIKNLFGIKEFECGDEPFELVGTNGSGKTSVIDAIRFALTNRSDRDYIIRNGETEGEILIETDNGLSINRKPRTSMSDYKAIKQNGTDIQSPEKFLKDIFTELQLNPVEFISMSKDEQNRVILDMIEFPWDLSWIRQQFGEIPQGVNYEQNILNVLDEIQSEKGHYFQTRQNINRDIRNKNAIAEDIGKSIPEGYSAAHWELKNLGELYSKITEAQNLNNSIDKAIALQDSKAGKLRRFEAELEIEINNANGAIQSEKEQLEKENIQMEERIKANKKTIDGLEEKRTLKVKSAEDAYKSKVSQYDAEISAWSEYVGMEKVDVAPLRSEAEHAEKMKSYVNEYHRMTTIMNEVSTLGEKSQALTDKIELARTLPGIVLKTAKIPVEGLSVKDGIPLIHGLPISNLSEGEKLDLCIDVAVQKPSGLQIILIDGVERMSTENRHKLYEKCKAKGLQFIATRTTDDNALSVVEL